MYFMLDNYDSFVYNLSAYFEELDQEILVRRADQVTLPEIHGMKPEGIIISPGPGRPGEAKLSMEIVGHLAGEIPILGVCLGHQVICESFGGRVEKGEQPMHGKVTELRNSGEGIFRGLPNSFYVTRYHSLTAAEDSLPGSLIVDAWSSDGAVMAVRHLEMPIFGVQFHPEAVLTEYGHELLGNFVQIAKEWRGHHADCKTA